MILINNNAMIKESDLETMATADLEVRARETLEEWWLYTTELKRRKPWEEKNITPDEYWRSVFGKSQSYVNMKLAAGDVIDNIKNTTIVGILPSNEAQARPLARLEPDQQVDIWEAAVESANGHQPTAKQVKTARSVHFSSSTDKHNTPQNIIDAVLECLDAIDLDPCSNGEPHNVPARQYYTEEQDGLTQEWKGRIYMNPPYGRDIDSWVDKLCREHEARRAYECLALVPARPDTQWWIKLRDYPVCFVEGRLKFGDAENSAPFPSALFYLGNHIDRFYYACEHLGDIWQRIEPGMFGE